MWWGFILWEIVKLLKCTNLHHCWWQLDWSAGEPCLITSARFIISRTCILKIAEWQCLGPHFHPSYMLEISELCCSQYQLSVRYRVLPAYLSNYSWLCCCFWCCCFVQTGAIMHFKFLTMLYSSYPFLTIPCPAVKEITSTSRHSRLVLLSLSNRFVLQQLEWARWSQY